MSLKNGNAKRGDARDFDPFDPPSLAEISERILETMTRQKEKCERAIERGEDVMKNRATLREVKKIMKTARAVRKVDGGGEDG